MKNEELKGNILRSLQHGIRFDGRRPLEYRTIDVQKNVTCNAEGSAKVKIGSTEVIAGVKLSIEQPYPDIPDAGTLQVNVELLPLSNPNFESGPPDIQSIELARVVDRGVRESKAIDMKKLCIEKGSKVWTIFVDICTINDEGNLFDAAALATVVALQETRFPKYDGISIDYKSPTDEKLPMITPLPVSVTVLKVGEQFIVDPTTEEEQVVDARLTVETLPDGTISALQKGGDSGITIEELKRMIEIGTERAGELRGYIENG